MEEPGGLQSMGLLRVGHRGLQETRVATREESGILCLPSRRGLPEPSFPGLCLPAPLGGFQAGLGKLRAQIRGGKLVNSPFAIKHNQEEIRVEPAALTDK